MRILIWAISIVYLAYANDRLQEAAVAIKAESMKIIEEVNSSRL